MPKKFDHDRATRLLKKVQANEYEILRKCGLRGENDQSLQLEAFSKLLGPADYKWFNGALRNRKFIN